jgi:hypothetical protein
MFSSIPSDFKRFLDMKKIKVQKLDVSDKNALKAMLKDGVDAVIVMLPHALVGVVAEAVIETRVNMVETMYGHMMPKGTMRKLSRGCHHHARVRPRSGDRSRPVRIRCQPDGEGHRTLFLLRRISGTPGVR